MISFSVLTKEGREELYSSLSEKIHDEELSLILDSFLDFTLDGAEVALTATDDGTLLVRIYDDGRYSFVYPLVFSDEADVGAALISISEYARRELIPIYLTDVPREDLPLITSIFPHVEARAYDEDEDGFVVCINSECDMLDGVPEISGEGIELSELVDGDAEDYARLVCDPEVNKFFGYDMRADMPDATPMMLLEVTRAEYHRGVALTFAVRREGKFIGEAVIYDYDYRGSAEFAIRILPEHQKRGVGKAALSLLIAVARGIRLKSLRARVMAENLSAIKMTEAYLPRIKSEGGIDYFELAL